MNGSAAPSAAAAAGSPAATPLPAIPAAAHRDTPADRVSSSGSQSSSALFTSSWVVVNALYSDLNASLSRQLGRMGVAWASSSSASLASISASASSAADRLDLVARLALAAITGILLLRLAFSLALAFGIESGRLRSWLHLPLLPRPSRRQLSCDVVDASSPSPRSRSRLRIISGERLLVVHRGFRLRQRPRRFLGQLRPPDRSATVAAAGGSLPPGQNFAHHEFQRIVHRRAATCPSHARIARPLAALLQHRVEILGDAIHGR